jgi:hypothetical protein
MFVEADHAVLLSADGEGGDVTQPASFFYRCVERSHPGSWVDFSAYRVWRGTRAEHNSTLCVTDGDLAGLGGGVNSGDEGHHFARPANTVEHTFTCRYYF